MLKKTLSILLLLALNSVAGQIPRIVWRCDTEAPINKKLDLTYGETVQLECQFRNYLTPLDILGATVILHGRTNGMDVGVSYQASGLASSNGLAIVTLPVDAWIPRGLTTCAWTLEVAQTNGSFLLRSRGTATLSESGIAATNSPVPASRLADEISARAAGDLAGSNNVQTVRQRVSAIESRTNAWDSCYSPSNPPPRQASVYYSTNSGFASVSGLSSNALSSSSSATSGAVTGNQAIVIATALQPIDLLTNRTETIWERNGKWCVIGDGMITEYSSQQTNLWVFSTDGLFINDNLVMPATNFYRLDLPFPLESGVDYGGSPSLSVGNYNVTFSLGNCIWQDSHPFDPSTTHYEIEGFYTGPDYIPSGIIRFYNISVITNSVVYLLSTNTAPSETWSFIDHTNWWSTTAPLYALLTDLVPESWSYVDHTNWWASERLNYVTSSYFSTWRVNHTNPLQTPDPHPQYAQHSETTNAALDIAHAAPQWLEFSGRTGLFSITNFFEQPIRISGTGAAVVVFFGLRDPLPIRCDISGFSSFKITNAYQLVGGEYQTNRLNRLLISGSDDRVLVSPITTEDLP